MKKNKNILENKNLDNKKKYHTFLTIPWYGWVIAIVSLIFHVALYKCAYLINAYCNIWKGICPDIPVVDDNIPFCPWFFIQIYFIAYGFWFIAPLIISKTSRENIINFIIGVIIISLVSFFIFIFIPTYQNRNTDGIPSQIEKIKDPFTKFCMVSIVKLDGGENKDMTAYNMAPSLHCIFSIHCFFGIYIEKNAKLYNKIWFGLLAFLICLSTLFTKQHYFIDVVLAIIFTIIFHLLIDFWVKPGNKIIVNYPNFLYIKKPNNLK